MLYPQLFRRSLRNDLQKNKIFSANDQSIAQNFHNHEIYGDNAVPDCSQVLDEELQPILREEIEIAIAAVERGKSVGADNIPA